MNLKKCHRQTAEQFRTALRLRSIELSILTDDNQIYKHFVMLSMITIYCHYLVAPY